MKPKKSETQPSHDTWKQKLSPEEYRVLREKSTEAPFTGEFWNHHAEGKYSCTGCGVILFTSDTKFDSGTGWPSFKDAIPGSIIKHEDRSHGMVRTEVLCANCGGHLGHLFDDGPDPKGRRYCINSISLKFEGKNVKDYNK